MVGKRGSALQAPRSAGDDGARVEKQALIPPFDPAALAQELEEAERPTFPPPFDTSSYALLLEDDELESGRDARETPRTMTAATPALSPPSEDSTANQSSDTIGRTMYGSYLASDYPDALVLAERLLEREPEHALAQLVLEGCRERLGGSPDASRLVPSSVVRLKRGAEELEELVERGRLEADLISQIVLANIDGVADVTMLATLAGIPRPQALHRLHALLELDVLEVVSA